MATKTTAKKSPKTIRHDIKLPMPEVDAVKFQAWCKTKPAIKILDNYDTLPGPLRKAMYAFFAYLSNQKSSEKKLDEYLPLNREFRRDALALIEKLHSDIPKAKRADYEQAILENKKMSVAATQQENALQKGREKGTASRVKRAKTDMETFDTIMGELFAHGGKGWSMGRDSQTLFGYMRRNLDKEMKRPWANSTLVKKIAAKKALIEKALKTVSGQ